MAIHLLDTNEGMPLAAWSIVGVVRDGVVSHLGLAAKDQPNVVRGQKVPVHHMGPPLTMLMERPSEAENSAVGTSENPEPEEDHAIAVHVAATLDDLNDDDRQGMRRWQRTVAAFFPETARPSFPLPRPGSEATLANFLQECHYIAHPPMKIETDPVSNRDKAHWYSCVGFVIACYESAPVSQLLVPWTDAAFPMVDKEAIASVFIPRTLKLTSELAQAINLDGEGPWPVVMPGYGAAAFSRPSATVRTVAYHPRTQDMFEPLSLASA